MAAAIAESFGQLASTEDRMAALNAIIDKLDPYELRVVKERFKSRTFHRDIVGSLPVELIILIFRYLDPAAPFKYQRVCKQWQTVLRSANVLRPSLSQWYSEADPPLQGENPMYGLSRHDIFLLKLEHMQRFRRNEPCSSATYHANFETQAFHRLPHLNPPFVFCHETAAWIDPGDAMSNHIVRTRNLRTGDVRAFVGQGREQFRSLALTERLVAAITFSGTCYVYDLHSQERTSFRLPSSQVKIFEGRGTVFAAMLSQTTDECPIVLWDYEEQATRMINVQSPRTIVIPDMSSGHQTYATRPLSLLVDPIHKTIAVLFGGRCGEAFERSYCCNQVVKYSFSGEKTFESRGRVRPDYEGSYMAMLLHPIDYDGTFLAGIYEDGSQKDVELYFERSCALITASDYTHVSQDCYGFSSDRHLYWKSVDFACHVAPHHHCVGLHGKCVYLGNEMYVIVLEKGRKGFRVLCFDPHVQLAESDWNIDRT